jgi:hypothetical protein
MKKDEVTIKELLQDRNIDIEQLLKGVILITLKDQDDDTSAMSIKGMGNFGKASIINVLVSMIEMLDLRIHNPKNPMEAFVLVKMVDAMITAYHGVLDVVKKQNIKHPDELLEVLNSKKGELFKQAQQDDDKEDEEDEVKVKTSKEDKHDA